MRSDILAEELRQRREAKRLKHRRALNRKHSRAFRKRQKLQKQQKEAAVSKHPTLSDAEIAAVEEVIAWEWQPRQVATPKITPGPAVDTEKKRIKDEEREQLVAEHIKELQVMKYGPPGPEPKRRIAPPFDLPNGIIL